MNALSVGASTGLSVYRGTTSGLTDDSSSYAQRVTRYDQYQYWYDNTMFDSINTFMTAQRANLKLYRHIRGIYNPVHRLVKLEVAKTYGGGIDWSGDLRGGAIPIDSDNPDLTEAIKTLLKWSNFGTEKGPYVHQGAKVGDSFLKIVDDVDRKRVRMEVLSPYKVRDVRFNEVGDIKWIAIQYYKTDNEGKDYIFREEIDTNEFRYWEEYKLSDFDFGSKRSPDVTNPNPYGFVPVRHVPHIKESGSRFGRPSFNGSLGKIVQLNDIAAPVHDAVRLSVNPLYVLKGSTMPDNTDDATRARDEMKTISISKDSDLTALSPTLDIIAGLAAMDKLIGEIERDMPQLSLQRIRESGGDASGVSIENSYSDASDLLVEIQGSYDEGLTRALQMAISVGAFRGYDQFKMFDAIKSYERGELDFYIKERPVFSDRLPQERRIQLLNESANLPTLPIVARELGLSEEDIAIIEASKSKSAADAMRGLAEGAFGGMDDDETDDEPTETPDTKEE